jgi:alpha-glucosidase
MLELYRGALALRRAEPSLRSDREPLRWENAAPGVLAFGRGGDFACVVNLSAEPVAAPVPGAVLLASGPLGDDGAIPPDTAVWIRPA